MNEEIISKEEQKKAKFSSDSDFNSDVDDSLDFIRTSEN